jgi:hypothetical protein
MPKLNPKQLAEAIIRIDYDACPLQDMIVVVKILTGPDVCTRATAEVERLNKLNSHKNVKYFRQTTRIHNASN